MATFKWKRKSSVVSKNNLFSEDGDDHNQNEEIDWLDTCKRLKTSNVISLEDAKTKSNRLKNEGITLADNERHWEAIKKWDEAFKLQPSDETLPEMMAQVYLVLNELLPAVKYAENCVKMNPKWYIGFQTLGRTYLGIGEVKMAIRSFSKAIHLQPDIRELWEDDLNWACDLMKQHQQMTESTAKTSENVNLINLDENSSSDEEKSNKQIAKWIPTVIPVTSDNKIDVKSRKWVRLRN